jgi:hypothetical protein
MRDIETIKDYASDNFSDISSVSSSVSSIVSWLS